MLVRREAENAIRGVGHQISAGLRLAGMKNDRLALYRPRDVERAPDLKEPTLVIQGPHPMANGHPINNLSELLPWNWKVGPAKLAARTSILIVARHSLTVFTDAGIDNLANSFST
jgi:hypothetical protein